MSFSTSPDPAVTNGEADHFIEWCDANDRDFEDPDALNDWHDELAVARMDAAAERRELQEMWD